MHVTFAERVSPQIRHHPHLINQAGRQTDDSEAFGVCVFSSDDIDCVDAIADPFFRVKSRFCLPQACVTAELEEQAALRRRHGKAQGGGQGGAKKPPAPILWRSNGPCTMTHPPGGVLVQPTATFPVQPTLLSKGPVPGHNQKSATPLLPANATYPFGAQPSQIASEAFDEP